MVLGPLRKGSATTVLVLGPKMQGNSNYTDDARISAKQPQRSIKTAKASFQGTS